MATPADASAVDYLVGLTTTEERRTAASISRHDLLAAVRALAGCQRCGFVEHVLAAFDPELAAAVTAAATPASHCTEAGEEARSGHPLADDAVTTAAAYLSSALLAPEPAASPAPAASFAGPSGPFGAASTGGIMAPAQVLALLSARGGSSDLVGLMQFAWRGAGVGRDAAVLHRGDPGGPGAGGSSGGDRLELSDSLLRLPRLMRRFLLESVAVMQALTDDVGDCRRHRGYPGPAELASTLARLTTQRCHTLQRLAAWGVLRPQAHNQQRWQQAQPANLPPASWRQANDGGAGDADDEGEGGDAVDDDPQLALAIQLSLGLGEGRGGRPPPPGAGAALHQSTAALSSPPSSDGCGPDGSLGQACSALPNQLLHQQQQQQAEPPRGAPLTPPRPTHGTASSTTAAAGGGNGAGGGARGESIGGRVALSLSGAATAAAAAAALTSAAVRSPGSWSGLGPAAPGPERLASRGAAGDPADLRAARTAVAAAAAAAAAGTRVGDGCLTAVEDPRQSPPPRHHRHHRHHRQQQQQQQQESLAEDEARAAPPVPLSVSAAAVAAAEGLSDASVFADAAAVAALSEGLRERVQHLVAQLVQVQQRLGRLEHAFQHGVLAAGRKLLLLLLQLLWTQLRRAAAAGLAADISPAAEAVVSPAAGAPASPSVTGARPLVEELSMTSPPPARSRSSGTATTSNGNPPQQQQQQRSGTPSRRPRYEGLLADLAAGLDEEETHMDLNLDPTTNFGLMEPVGDLNLDLDLDLHMRAELGALGILRENSGAVAGVEVGALVTSDVRASGSDEQSRRGGQGGDDDAGGGLSSGDWDAALNVATVGRGIGSNNSNASSNSSGRSTGSGSEILNSESSDDGALSHGRLSSRSLQLPAATSSAVALRRSAAMAAASVPALASLPIPFSSSLPRPSTAAAAAGSRHLAVVRGGGGGGGSSTADGYYPDKTGRCCGGGGGGSACQPGCLAAREQAAEQLRTLQAQLARCQSSQWELQGEVGRLLDSIAQQRRAQEQATAALRRELGQWQADPAALSGLGAEELGTLAGRLEAALGRVRAAQLQAAAERDLQCPVCWERRRGLVFGCGHQTCGACGERLAACPICRQPVSLRIRTYS